MWEIVNAMNPTEMDQGRQGVYFTSSVNASIAKHSLLSYCAPHAYGPGTFCLLFYTKDGGGGLVVKSCQAQYASRTDGRSISSEIQATFFFFKYNFAANCRLKDLLIRKGLNIGDVIKLIIDK